MTIRRASFNPVYKDQSEESLVKLLEFYSQQVDLYRLRCEELEKKDAEKITKKWETVKAILGAEHDSDVIYKLLDLREKVNDFDDYSRIIAGILIDTARHHIVVQECGANPDRIQFSRDVAALTYEVMLLPEEYP